MLPVATQFHGAGTGDIRCLLVDPSVVAPSGHSRSQLAESRQAVALVKVLFGDFGADEEIFLLSESSLPEFLLTSYGALLRSFGSGASFRLRLFIDPESPMSPRMLFVGISTQGSVTEALEQLRAFDDSWFLDRVEEVAGRVNFTLDFS